jgi:hypothetical protein
MIEKIVKAISQTIKPDISASGIATAVIGAIGIGLITTGTRKMTESITASALKSELDKEPDYLVQLYDEHQNPVLIGKL